MHRLIADGTLIVIRRGGWLLGGGWLVCWSGGLVGRRQVCVGGIAGRSLRSSLILRLIAGSEAREQQHGDKREAFHARNVGTLSATVFRTRR